MEEVVALNQLVGELRETHAAFQSILHAVLGHHVIHRDVLAHVSNEVQKAHAFEPVVVVHHHCCIASFEVKEPLQLSLLTSEVVGNGVDVEQLAFGCFAAGVANHSGGAADQCDRNVPGALPVNQQHDGHQVANVQAVGCRVEADVCFHRALLKECLRPRHDVMQQPAPFQFVNQRHDSKIRFVMWLEEGHELFHGHASAPFHQDLPMGDGVVRQGLLQRFHRREMGMLPA